MHRRRGTGARAPRLPTVQFSDHFRAAQTLDIGLYVVAYPEKIHRPIALSLFIA